MPEPSSSPTCPVCRSTRCVLTEIYLLYSILCCEICGLEFSDPMSFDEAAYKTAYKGTSLVEQSDYKAILTSLQPYLERNDIKGLLEVIPSTYPFALKAVKRVVAKQGTVLDVGCGTGVFLALLKDAGIRGIGLDIAPQPIQFLKVLGFEAFEGTVEQYPVHASRPDAVCALEVLEHLPDPVKFLRRLRERFPSATCLISVPSPLRETLRRGKRESFDYPPHHLTRWSTNALSIAFGKAGYNKVDIQIPAVEAKDVTLGFLDFLGRRVILSRHQGQGQVARSEVPMIKKIAKRMRRVLCVSKAKYLTLLGYTGTSMIAIGEP